MQFCFRIPKNAIYFYIRQVKKPKIAFQKCDVTPLPVSLAIAQQKRYYFEIVYACCLYVSRSDKLRFFDNLKFWIL